MPYSEFSSRYRPQEGASIEEERRAILQELQKAHNAEQRVEFLANVFDKKGVDFFLGLIPVLGDGAVALGLTAYLLYEAFRVGLPKKDVFRILQHQSVDFAVGSIPLVGDALDLFWSKANVKSLRYFQRNTKNIMEIAEQKGISSQEIEGILAGAKRLRKNAEVIVKNSALRRIMRSTRENMKGLLPPKD